MANLLDRIRRQRETILGIARSHHAENVRMFGSVVRGEDHPASDIDFLVDFQPQATLFDQVGLIDELSKKLGRKVDVVSSRALNKHLAHKIFKEAVKL